MNLYSVKEFFEKINIEEYSVRRYIRNGKLAAKKDINGCYLIPESELHRCLGEKRKIDSGHYFNAEDLDIFRIRRTILYDGSVEVEILLCQHYVKWDTLKEWRETQDGFFLIENSSAMVTIEVRNARGVHLRPSALICRACNKYLSTGTKCEILYQEFLWTYPLQGLVELSRLGGLDLNQELPLYALEYTQVSY